MLLLIFFMKPRNITTNFLFTFLGPLCQYMVIYCYLYFSWNPEISPPKKNKSRVGQGFVHL